jgi:hypothetical protein
MTEVARIQLWKQVQAQTMPKFRNYHKVPKIKSLEESKQMVNI